MKKSLLLAGIAGAGLLAACGEGESVQESHTVSIQMYGPEKVDTTKAISTAEMLKDFDKTHEEQEYTVKGEIVQVCQAAGCWVKLKTDGEPLMLFFQNHFSIPKNTEKGTEAFFHGWTYQDTTSVEMLKHYAEDAGKSKEEIAQITQPEIVTTFEADGVLIKKETRSVKKS